MTLWDAVARHIGAATGAPFAVRSRLDVGGGCINAACVLDSGGERFFVKSNAAEREAMFAAEFAGLEEIRRSRSVRVPEPVCFGAAHGRAYLVLEYLPLAGRGAESGAEALGRQLAAMHAFTRPAYGWERDNTIGATPQRNPACGDWTRFWLEQRLGFQLELAARNGHARLRRPGERLLGRLPALLAGHRPPASLLHGDLWSGNHGFTADGAPVIFDPAVYYGDRETDLAMTELFGGFPDRFYAAYREALPLEDGYGIRKILYNLYHVLNHLNLFGAGYLSQAEDMIEVLS
jgi:fructosamine-3-kinase